MVDAGPSRQAVRRLVVGRPFVRRTAVIMVLLLLVMVTDVRRVGSIFEGQYTVLGHLRGGGRRGHKIGRSERGGALGRRVARVVRRGEAAVTARRLGHATLARRRARRVHVAGGGAFEGRPGRLFGLRPVQRVVVV